MILNLARRTTQIEWDPFRERLWPYQADDTTDTKPSFSEARQKIRPEAFSELNTVFVNRYYDDEEYRTFHGFRVCAIDGSSQQLPDSPQLRAEYGGATGKGTFAVAKARPSPLYEVLNGIVVDARIAPFRTGEREWARQPVEAFLRLAIRQIATLMLFDHGYPSLPLLLYLISHHIRPVMRVPVSFYPTIIGVAKSNTWVTLTLSSAQARHGGRSDRGHRGPAPRHQTAFTDRSDRNPRHHVNRRRNAGRSLWRIICPAVGDRSPLRPGKICVRN